MAELSRKEVVLILASVPDIACRRPHHRIRLAGVDLSGLDLSGLNLAHADLGGANLRGCDLSDARLFEADLSSADLTDASLRGVFADGATFVAATLVRADFRGSRRDLFYGTHLVGADFEGADLTDARLDGAQLRGARLCGAILTGTSLGDDASDAPPPSPAPLADGSERQAPMTLHLTYSPHTPGVAPTLEFPRQRLTAISPPEAA